MYIPHVGGLTVFLLMVVAGLSKGSWEWEGSEPPARLVDRIRGAPLAAVCGIGLYAGLGILAGGALYGVATAAVRHLIRS